MSSRAFCCMAFLCIIGLATGCRTDSRRIGPAQAAERIRPEALRAHLEFLADDLLEGRGTGSRGHKLAVTYLRAQCQALGLQGGAGGGSFLQKVPLVRPTVEEGKTTFELSAGDSTKSLVCNKDFALLDTHRDTEGRVSAGIVFAGFGVTAPEQGYDDYAGLDAKGKLVALLSFDSPSSLPPDMRDYYAGFDVRQANAVAHGAIGILSIGPPSGDEAAWAFFLQQLRVGFNAVRWLDSDGRPGGFDDSQKACVVLNNSGAEALFVDEAHELAEVYAAAEKGTPPRFALSKKATIKYRSRHKKLESDNVVAVLEGSDPVLKREYVLLCARADHVGIGNAVDGDAIYNGATDNAGGCALVLEAARAFAALPERPRRSILFLFVTGEEAGLVGSDYFACHPTVPIQQIVAAINCDTPTWFAPVSDVVAWGAEHSSLLTAVRNAAGQTGFTVSPDPLPGWGLFCRSDHFAFARKGIPATMVNLGITGTRPGVDPRELLNSYLNTILHSPKDDAHQPICYESGTQLARFVFRLSHGIAMQTERPRWNDHDFFGRKFTSAAR